MLLRDDNAHRDLHSIDIEADLVVVGGGLAGCCCAITAAREGLQVALVQDRPVLGGNASSEVRLWTLGATSHMGNNNRWAREGGVIDEILVENTYRNPEGNAVLLDSLILEKVTAEPKLRLLLNTSVYDLHKEQDNTISAVVAFCSQNSTRYTLRSRLFCDASGDGIVGFLSGAAFRIGAEARSEFGEQLAPLKEHRELLGHSLYFYTRDTGQPIQYVAPSFALEDITQIPRYKSFNSSHQGCQLWWIELGGSRDTVHESEEIKWDLWKIVYGVWNHIKNSGQFPEAETLTLEWVGLIPGKRESRRFEGDYMLTQQDIVEQRPHNDAVSYGGWAIDLHPVDSIFSKQSPCTQWHSKGVYGIPYRCMYSRNIANLFLAGRVISSSHIAFGSTRVMATCAHNAQAVGMAAVLCHKHQLQPRDVGSADHIHELQQALVAKGQFIPQVAGVHPDDLARRATVTTSSEFQLTEFPPSGETVPLTDSLALMVPVRAGRCPQITMQVAIPCDCELQVQLRTCSRLASFTPDTLVEQKQVALNTGPASHLNIKRSSASTYATNGPYPSATSAMETSTVPQTHRWHQVAIDFEHHFTDDGYAFVCFMANPDVTIQLSNHRVSGLLTLTQRGDRKVARGAVQSPPADSGIDTFEFWLPERRPGGKNIAARFSPPVSGFQGVNLVNGWSRPTTAPNCWTAALSDPAPVVELQWDEIQSIQRIALSFDTDFDHAMETVLMGHPERIMPLCVQRYRVWEMHGELLCEKHDNHQTRNEITFDKPIRTDRLRVEIDHPSPHVPASLFSISCYAE
ncbi:FAD-dependent oxidoreductase [Aeoliella mucimassa]|uniref:Putative FAD-binding dehydrogenase n=1 Tax=Aeoliella mucimassa TaxID=2527972 RepID=A0A518AR94_9BACT|nr:FAD-dependent oxidoreductase [Aeoliella mucimassa]QDU57226.1 putative FAD-binding dehydrogenase [Aeoliella mucimassa]